MVYSYFYVSYYRYVTLSILIYLLETVSISNMFMIKKVGLYVRTYIYVSVFKDITIIVYIYPILRV
jgi:hypothetical protein